MVTVINQGKFGPAEAVVLLALSMSARVFLNFTAGLMDVGENAAWMTPIGGLLVALAGVLIMGKLLAQSSDKNIVQITEETLGPYLGTAVNLIYVIFFLFIAAMFTREFSEEMLIDALPYTPISVVTAAFVAVCLLSAYLGIEVMARGARMMYPFIAGGIIILLIALYPVWNFHNLFPILGSGPYDVFVQGTYRTAAVTEIILMGVIVQSIGGYKQIGSIGFKMVMLSFFFLIIMLLITSLTYNWRIAEEFTFPFYRLAKTIYLGRFFQRVEAIYIIIWSFIAILKIAVTLYGAAATLATTLKLPYYQPLLWPLGMVVFIVNLLPPDMPTTVYIDSTYLRPFALIPNYIIPVILLLILWFKGRRKNAG